MASDFSKKDLFLPINAPIIEYSEYTKTNNTHWGQLKLIIEELAFFVYFLSPQLSNGTVVYVGAASGQHIPILARMFPTLSWELYDPSEFSISEKDFPSGKIKIFTGTDGLFDKNKALMYANRSDIIFISDIRRELTKQADARIRDEENEMKNDEIIIEDMNMQKEWIETIQPEIASLKFRLPWTLPENGATSFNYFDGYIMLQPFAPVKSTESRLIPKKDSNGTYSYRDWDIKAYEGQMYRHNIEIRDRTFYKNPISRSDAPFLKDELLNDYDSVATCFILGEYLRKMNVTPVSEKVVALYLKIVESINKFLPSGEEHVTLAKKRKSIILKGKRPNV
mgnify:CR=1 FL=1